MARTGDLALARLHLDFDQRCRLVVRLFSVPPAHVANQASLGGALAGLARLSRRLRLELTSRQISASCPLLITPCLTAIRAPPPCFAALVRYARERKMMAAGGATEQRVSWRASMVMNYRAPDHAAKPTPPCLSFTAASGPSRSEAPRPTGTSQK
jgi:hypothetical protein